MKNKKKTTNKPLKPSPMLELFNWMADQKPKKSDASKNLDHLTESKIMQRLKPKGFITTEDIINHLRPTIHDHVLQSIIENNKKTFENSHKDKIEICLTPNGTLYRYVGKEKLIYDAHGAKRRIQILRFLKMQNYNFIETKEIAKRLGAPSDGSIRKTVQDFNDMAKIKLKLGIDIIDSKQDSGYKVDSGFFIKDVEK